MRKHLTTLTLSLLTAGLCWSAPPARPAKPARPAPNKPAAPASPAAPTGPAEPVVKVQDIKPVSENAKAVLMQKRPADAKPYQAFKNTTGYVQDHYITDKNTVAALEFLIGGRVGINKDTDVEVVNERSVADGKTNVKRVILKSGALWVKADAKTLKQPLEIQTNGGVMGIKGTEFTVEQKADGSTNVACFESNSDQGGIEYRDNNGKLLSTIKPLEEFQIKAKNADTVDFSKDVTVKKYESLDDMRDTYSQIREYSLMFNTLSSWMGSLGVPLPAEFYQVNSVIALANVEDNPAGAVYALNSLGVNTGPVGGMVGMFGIGGGKKEPPKPDFPSELSPDAGPDSKTDHEAPPYPTFQWKGVEDARSYAIAVSPDEKMDEIIYFDQIRAPEDRDKVVSINYPSTARPLEAGKKYYWRVVPLDGEDNPTQKAAQTIFTVKAN